MKINFKRMHLYNFMSFAEAEVNLDGRSFVTVNGINNNPSDAAKSNGSGKSAIFDAIVWALTGDTVRGCKDVVNLHGNDGAYVEIVFEIDGTKYQLLRSKDHSTYKTNLKIHVNGVDKSGKGIRDSEKLLAEYLPDLTSELIGSVIVLGQGLPQRFTNNTASGRKDTLEKLSKSDFMIEDLKKRVAIRKADLSDMLRQHEDAILHCKTQYQMISDGEDKARARLEELEGMTTLTELIRRDTGILADIQGNIEKQDKLIADLEEQFNTIHEEAAALAKEFSDNEQKIKNEYDALIEEKSHVTVEAKIAFTGCENDLKHAKAELVKLQSVTDVCPTCGRKLDGVEKPDTTQAEKTVADLTAKLCELKQAYDNATHDELSTRQQRDKALAEYAASISGCKQDIADRTKACDTERLSANATMRDLRTSEANLQNTIHNYEIQLATRDAEIASCKQTIIESVAAMDNLSNAIDYNTKECEIIKQRTDINAKFSNALSREFRGCLLKSVIDFINITAKKFAQYVFNNDLIEFILNGNNIDIMFQGKQYEMLSGGERQKLDLIIQFAIREMLCTYSNFSSNIVILDEIMDFLDIDGCDAVINLIQNSLSDVSSVFVVTHHTDLSLPSDDTITVIKDATGVSHIA